MKRLLAVREHATFADIALVLLRASAGIAFMLHGWMGPNAFAPSIFQGLATFSEFGGGLAWVLGFVTPLASLGIACTMVVAASMHALMRGDPFVSMTGGPSYELATIYLGIALVLMSIGPGRFSLDRILFGTRD